MIRMTQKVFIKKWDMMILLRKPLSASGGDLNTALKTVERSGLKKNGKNYNLNFNLDDE